MGPTTRRVASALHGGICPSSSGRAMPYCESSSQPDPSCLSTSGPQCWFNWYGATFPPTVCALSLQVADNLVTSCPASSVAAGLCRFYVNELNNYTRTRGARTCTTFCNSNNMDCAAMHPIDVNYRVYRCRVPHLAPRHPSSSIDLYRIFRGREPHIVVGCLCGDGAFTDCSSILLESALSLSLGVLSSRVVLESILYWNGIPTVRGLHCLQGAHWVPSRELR